MPEYKEHEINPVFGDIIIGEIILVQIPQKEYNIFDNCK